MSSAEFEVFRGDDRAAIAPTLEGVEVRDDAEPADAGDECRRGED